MLIMLQFDSLTQTLELGKSSQKTVYKYRYFMHLNFGF